LIIVVLFFSSCSENPSITGYSLLNPIYSLFIKKFDSTTDSVFLYHKEVKQIDILGGTRRILVGKYDDLTAYSLIRFIIGLSSEMKDAIKNSNFVINSARIKLNPVYRFGDTTSNVFSFQVKEIYTYFDEYKFTIDSLKSGRYEINNENIVVRNIDDDTLYYSELNPEKVFNWLKLIAADSSRKLQGVLLEPEISTNYIKGFASSNAYYVGDPIVLEIVATYNNKTDSLKYFVQADLHVIEKSSPIYFDDNQLVLQSGVKQKAFIYFDISSVPKNAVVNSAYLRLYPDTLQSKYGTSYQDSLLVQYITDSTNISIDSAVTFVLTKTSSGYYEGQLNYFVQKWIDNDANKGLLLSIRDPDGGVEKFVFFGPKSAIVSKRPQLIINYSYRK
jgi:hypothetical protein